MIESRLREIAQTVVGDGENSHGVASLSEASQAADIVGGVRSETRYRSVS
jgi:hypothetical protein